MRIKLTILLLAIFFIFPSTVGAEGVWPEVRIFDFNGSLKKSFFVLGDGYQGNIGLTVADLGGDGIDEIVVSAGSVNDPKVEVWRTEGSKIFDFLAYSKTFTGGVFLSSGDINNDNKDEIITSPGYGGGAHIRVFSGDRVLTNFFGFNDNLRNGARVMMADLGGDGKSEILVSSNINQESEIIIYDNGGRKLISKVLSKDDFSGVNLAKIDYNGDGKSEIMYSLGYPNKSEVVILNQQLKEIKRFRVFDDNYKGGINLASGDVNGDGHDEIIVGASFGGGAHVKIYDRSGENLLKQFFAYDKGYRGGVVVATGDVNGDGRDEIITVPERITKDNKYYYYKYIEVDLSKQELYYWQNGYKLGMFSISSGLSRTPTPVGTFSVYLKRPSVLMAGSDYYLPAVPWVTSFYGPYTIHGTYWHGNFGQPMSHGCINMYTPEAKLIYNWSDIGTPVIIY